jgi:uncharacterized protein (DUF2235 family)
MDRAGSGNSGTKMARNIVVCSDGTRNQLRATGSTNTVLGYEMLDLGGRSDLAYYGNGVGKCSAPSACTPIARRQSGVAGIAFGPSLRQHLAEVDAYVMENWLPGDRICIVVVGRGAFPVRGAAATSTT